MMRVNPEGKQQGNKGRGPDVLPFLWVALWRLVSLPCVVWSLELPLSQAQAEMTDLQTPPGKEMNVFG